MSELPAALVLRYFAMWNTGDASAAYEVVGDEFVDHSRPEVVGPGSLSEAIRVAREDDPAIHVFVDAVLGEGPTLNVVGRVRISTETGERLRNRTWTMRVDDRIAEIWRY